MKQNPPNLVLPKDAFNPPCEDPFVNRFCRCSRGRTGIVLGYKLVPDLRPGHVGLHLRYVWYGINYVTGRDWQSFKPVPLSAGELQKITWAWGGSQTPAKRAKATEERTSKPKKAHGVIYENPDG